MKCHSENNMDFYFNMLNWYKKIPLSAFNITNSMIYLTPHLRH